MVTWAGVQTWLQTTGRGKHAGVRFLLRCAFFVLLFFSLVIWFSGSWLVWQLHSSEDTLAEWLRRRPAKPVGSARVGSNPTGVGRDYFAPYVYSSLLFTHPLSDLLTTSVLLSARRIAGFG